MINNKDLLTECEVCTGKYLPEVSCRPSDEGARSVRKNRVNKVNKEFIIWLLVYFLLKFATLFLSSEFAVTLFCYSFFVSLIVYTNSAFVYRVFN